MSKSTPSSEELIAPCGMNCGICSKYLAYINGLKKSQCSGCRPGDKKCNYLFGKCTGINHFLIGNAQASFCFECDQFPCKEINRMDRRYKTSYKMSVKDNLEYIKKHGLKEFTKNQYKEYHCVNCGVLKSVHNRKCFKCESIRKLVEIEKK